MRAQLGFLTARRLLTFAACLLALGVPRAAAADNAPMWESPEGLTPGVPNSRVQMTAEAVHIQVLEKNDGVYADVSATFDMLNPGPDVQMLVGFPAFAANALPSDADPPYSPVTFSRNTLSNFRASSSLGSYTAGVRTVTSGPFRNSDWYVWSMVYPGGKPLRVAVAYQQQLLKLAHDTTDYPPPASVPVSYVLRTGALWDGLIGRATISLTSPNGGQLLQVGPPGQAADGQLLWTMTNFKPKQDLDATYIRAESWSQLRAIEATAAPATATADDLVSGATSVLRVFGADPAAEFGIFRLAGYRAYNPAFGTRYMPLVTAWVQRAIEADPTNGSAWELAGQLGQLANVEKHGHLVCWPAAAADAYQHAADLGQTSAAAMLDGMLQDRELVQPLEDCPS